VRYLLFALSIGKYRHFLKRIIKIVTIHIWL